MRRIVLWFPFHIRDMVVSFHFGMGANGIFLRKLQFPFKLWLGKNLGQFQLGKNPNLTGPLLTKFDWAFWCLAQPIKFFLRLGH